MAGKHQAQHVKQPERKHAATEKRRRDADEDYDYYPRKSRINEEYHEEAEQPVRARRSYEADSCNDYNREYRSARAGKQERKKLSLGGKFAIDALMTCVILVVFAFFHHVLPGMTKKTVQAVDIPKATQAVVVTEAPTEVKPAEIQPSEEEQPQQEEPTETEAPHPLTWKEKFADKFTDEIVQTDNSYSSPNISISISTHAGEEYGSYLTFYVADIYVSSIENFQTYFATGEFGYYASDSPQNMDRQSNAIIAINGDYCNNQYEGLLVRNGQLFFSEQTMNDICVLYYDGTMETYKPDEYVSDDIIAASPYQSWKFGPALLDRDGRAYTEFEMNNSIEGTNPRCGLGYYEPGHYCFVVCDGRQDHSIGATIVQFAKIFEDLGCARAYNMDGGATACMTFNDRLFSKPSNGGRDPGDMLLICEVPEK